MATEDTAGGARKATKSKLFEFLVHGVVSASAVRHSSRRSGLCAGCVCGRRIAVLGVSDCLRVCVRGGER